MINKYFFLLVLFSLTLININLVYAESVPKSTHSDSRIQIAYYDPNQVYRLRCKLGYTSAIQFAADEKVLSVNIGDSSSWLVNVQQDVINIKPVAEHAKTNMNVVTSQGTYQFFLSSLSADSKEKHPIFLLRFQYPKSSAASHFKENKSHYRNIYYSARGNSEIAPTAVFDDGKFTYFDFSSRQHIPAIFSVDNHGNESIVNYHLMGHFVIVETTSKQFTLRDGNQVASVFNDGPH